MPTTPQPRLWVVPLNDGEAVELARLLTEAGERVLLSRQRWGASWAGLEPEIQAELRAAAARIYGIELAGPNPYGATNIDHHRYSGDDRSHPFSSLEQVATLLARPLDRRQTLIALNDRGYIPAMEAVGATPAEVAAIRRADLQAQGRTEDEDRHAARDVAAALWREDCALVWCPDGASPFHTDRLYGRAREVLLLSPRDWSYTGPRHRQLQAQDFPEKHWAGGADASGYFGIQAPGVATRTRILRLTDWWPLPPEVPLLA